MSKKIGIVRFLGTNCDRDIWQAIEAVEGQPEWLWYKNQFNPTDYDGIIVPGGFSYGDYLRCGALAAKAPVMASVSQAAQKGIPILGICNGFQILCESGLLPGTLVQNRNLRFVDKWSQIQLENSCSFFAGDTLSECSLPIAHGEGRFFIDEDKIKRLFDQQQIWWTYVDNPNGSIQDVAGVMNESKNVAALMPHPERALFDWMGGTDGRNFFTTLVSQL